MTIPANNPDSAVSPQSASAFVPQAKCRRNATHSSFAKISTAAVLLLLLTLCAAAVPAAAEGGTTGNLTWDLTDGTLTISGNGAMLNYSSGGAPWYSYYASITSVVVESGVTSIGSYAFFCCSCLTSIEIPSSVTIIRSNAFSYCSCLTSISLPSGVTSIGSYAFTYCSGLTSFVLPPGVTSIGSQAFYGCSGLTSLVLPSGVTSIGQSAFSGCSGLTSFTFAEGSKLTSIGSYAFSGCSGLTSLVLPSGVTSIGDGAFSGCSSLTSINVDEKNTKYKDIDGVLFSKDGTLLHTYPAGKSATSYEIPSGVTSIGDGAFRDCSGLTSFTFAKGSQLTSIGSYAFYGCSGLTSISLPSGVTSIGSNAFRDCSGLTSISLPSGVTSIGSSAFSYCSCLTSISLPSGVTSIGSSAFSWLAENSIIYCSNAAPLSGKYSTSRTALAVKNTDGSCTFTSAVTNLALSAANAPSGITYGGWFKESTFTTPVTSIAKGTNPTLWLKIIPAYNNITVTSTAGGDASASPSSAIEGTVISLNADAALGYLFKEWQVLSGGVTIVNNQFTMPDCDVEIKAVFEPDDDFEWLVLSPGWNFVSVPINLSSANDTAEKLFAGVDTTDKSILSYNAETKLWELVRASTKITPLNAYWIYSVDERTLTPVFNTAASTPAAKNVYEGWNAAGLSAEEPMSASAVFNNMGWRTYISWNATEQKYNTAIIKGGSGIYSDDNLLYLWKGGWVYMDEDGTYPGYA